MAIFANQAPPLYSKALEIKKNLLQGCNTFNHLKHIQARPRELPYQHDLAFQLRIGKHSPRSSCFHSNPIPEYLLLEYNDPRLCFQQLARQIYRVLQLHEKTRLVSKITLLSHFVLKACARLLDLGMGMKIHSDLVKLGFELDVFVKTSLVCLYAECGCLEDAVRVFDGMDERNVVSWTTIISGYMGFGKFDEAIDMVKRMLEMGLRPDNFTLVRVLSVCSQLGDLRNGERT